MAGLAGCRQGFLILKAEVHLGEEEHEVLRGEAECDQIEAAKVPLGEAEGDTAEAVKVPQKHKEKSRFVNNIAEKI